MISSTESSRSKKRKIYVWAAIVLIAGIAILFFLFLRRPRNITSPTPSTTNPMPSQIAQTTDHTGNTQLTPEEKTYSPPKEQPRPADQPSTRLTPQNIPNSARPPVQNPIRSIVLYVRITYEVENGAALPQGAVPFVPVEDDHAYLEGPGGTVRIDLIWPVRFEKQDDRHVIVINNFSLPASSNLYSSPVETLKNFDFISIPMITAGYESLFKAMVYLDGRFELNGRYVTGWGYSSDSILEIQDGATIRIPLSEVIKQKFEKK